MNTWPHIDGANRSKEHSTSTEHTASSAVQLEEQREPQGSTAIDQFNFISTIEKGVFGKIMLAESKFSSQLYAIKILKKDIVLENNEVRNIKAEKNVFVKAREHNHPFIVQLFTTLETDARLYFVMEYLPGGDLNHHIQKGKFDVVRSRFYGAEFCLVLKFLHKNGIIYRDVKLDNIMLTSEGHIKVMNFGVSAERLDDHYAKTKSFCGTTDIMAPEILLDENYGRAVDWWGFGVIMYQMLLQQSPFCGENEDEVYDAILTDEPYYPPFMPADAQDLIEKLFVRQPEQRFGYHKGAEEIMNHDFFKTIDWRALYRKEVTPPYRPVIKDRDDLSNFDMELTNIPTLLTPVNSILTSAMQDEFNGFSSDSVPLEL